MKTLKTAIATALLAVGFAAPASAHEYPSLRGGDAKRAARMMGDQLTDMFLAPGAIGKSAVVDCKRVDYRTVSCTGVSIGGSIRADWTLRVRMARSGKFVWAWYTKLGVGVRA